MKCDVCGTKIPLGYHECPNCGYKIKGNYASVYDTDNKNHEHIRQPQQKKMKTILNGKKMDPFLLLKGKLKLFIPFFVAFAIMAAVAVIAVPKYLSSENSFRDMTLSEVVASGKDDGSAALALSQKDEFQAFINQTGIEDVHFDEVASDVDSNIRASLSAYGTSNHVDYSVFSAYSLGELEMKILNINFDSTKSIKETGKLPINKNQFDQIAKFIGVDDAASFIESHLVELEKTKDDGREFYEYISTKEPQLYIKEEYDKEKGNYSEYISINTYFY